MIKNGFCMRGPRHFLHNVTEAGEAIDCYEIMLSQQPPVNIQFYIL